MSLCIHCDQQVATAHFSREEPQKGPFCCWGCLSVYNVIHYKGLDEYYEIKKNVAFFKKRAPVEISTSHYSYLDDPNFLAEYSYFGTQDERTMDFYLEGIHCLACLWIIEKVPEFIPEVRSTKLNMGRSVVTVVLKEAGKFSLIARELENLGYKPHPLKMNQKSKDLKTKEEQAMLLRIGVAGAAAGNIMLYSVSLYAGAAQDYPKLFNFLTVLFAIPVLTYSAYPFYKTSWMAIKNKTLSIDIPISLALIMGGVMGFYNLLIDVQENYFDSLSALVFLLLLSRYFLKAIQEMGLNSTDLHFFYQGESVLKIDEANPGELLEIHPKFIKVNDLIKVLPNQLIPADGVILSGETYLNNSLLTGESQLQKAKKDDFVFSGTMNMGEAIVIKVSHISTETRLGKILRNIENGWGQKANIVDITNVVSKYFVAVVFILSIILFLWTLREHSLRHALEQALTLLIVTCPCALAIATPLTFLRTLSLSAKKGIVIKDDSVIEKLAKAETIFIDKTGTITQNNLQVIDFNSVRTSFVSVANIISNLEKNSRHPKALTLKNFTKDMEKEELDVEDLKETPGVGVSGIIQGQFYEIKNNAIYENGSIVATYKISDILRGDAVESIEKLRDLKLKIKVLSGDKQEYVEAIANQIGFSKDEYQAELSPEDKAQIIKNSPNSIMVGDGANDAIALSCASTGIAVFGAMDISLRAADVFLSLPGLISVSELIIISKETMKVVYRNLVLSLFYNSFSVVLAFTGYISPLTAAIIMPLSSLTVLISTLIGTKKLRAAWK